MTTRSMRAVASQPNVSQLFKTIDSEMELLLALGKYVVSETELETLLRLVADYARDLIDADTLAVPIIDFAAKQYEYRAASGKIAPLLLGQRLPLSAGMCGWVLSNRQPLFFGRGGALPIGNKVHWEEGMESALLVPVISRNKIIGGLSGLGKTGGGSFTRRDQDLLTLFASQVSVAIENAQVIAELSQQRQMLQRALEQTHYEKERAEVVIETVADGMMITDIDGVILRINRACEALIGYSREQAVGRAAERVIRFADEYGQPLEHPLRRALSFNRTVQIEPGSTATAENGRIFDVEGTVSIMRGDAQDATGLVMLLRDVTEQHKLTRQIHHYATYDELTGLFNRREFKQRLEELLAAQAGPDAAHALCYLDLDQFKVVNDTCGHIAGDELLRQLGGLLGALVRPDDLLGRIGGDEFGLLLRDCDADCAVRLAEGVREGIERFLFTWSDKSFRISVSIGVAIVDPEDASINRLLSAADQACYAAKEQGRNRVKIFAPADLEMQQRSTEMQWVERIHNAIAGDRFELFYQPILSLDAPEQGLSRRYEILIRMRQADGERLNPGEFIPAAERYGLIRSIDRWVIRNYLGWLRANPRHLDQLISGSINLSGSTLGDREMSDFIRDEIAAHQIPAEKLCFEITETSAIANLMDANEFIRNMRSTGVRFSLDDFGTGLSSLGYLKDLPIDQIKIDGSFIRHIHQQPADAALVRAMVDIGRSMDKKMVAEFVESAEILEVVRGLGIHYAQGYHISEPRPLCGLSD